MRKRIIQMLRAGAESGYAARPFCELASGFQGVLMDWKGQYYERENWSGLSPVERRMFCLFVAEALETQ